MSFFVEVAIMAVQLVFGIALFVAGLRIILPLSRARFSNPLCQLVYKVTNPLVGPLSQILPPYRKLSIAAVVLGWLIILVEVCVILLLLGTLPNLLLIPLSLGGLLYYLLGFAFWAIVIRAIMSFFTVDYSNPAVEVLYAITDPLLKPFDRLPPHNVGFNLSPMYAGFAIRVAMLLLTKLFGPYVVLFARL
ncbi:YggT family protein [Tahibacter amnicola]|uniref:YggT family protein n=1 Tax=Tahibacter amnicola TaxID=2976241 RepID=A0ABY6BH47_9GAMM|nr:YggT family protein [Tahibacter amnicola]UXI69348.1 YggT family protein [Tahibacter amnicola]